jgi:ATP-dependent Clp protease ATP-binding subunit ClpA
MPTFSESLELSLQRAIAIAGADHHEYTTLEHLLLALTDDAESAAVLHACNVDLEKLRRNLVSFIHSEPAKFETDGSESPKPSAAFQRVVRRAVIHVQSTTRREQVTAANLLVSILRERGSQASAALEEQGMTRYDATLYICHGIARRIGFRLAEQRPRQAISPKKLRRRSKCCC